ncbi:MAG: GNAT family N-acetyltransferase [Gammaproteobacteria bacterium]|nr:GNAT family N-acetyltransferase [Gammaproteobacteria bacterium]
MNISIRHAHRTEASELSTIAKAAKKSWGYPDHWLELWSDSLNITPEFIEQHNVWVATADKSIVGFVAIRISNDTADVEHMWVTPPAMGQGVGKRLIYYCLDFCKTRHIKTLRIESDPNARGFYEKFGAKQTGEVPSTPAPRVLPVLAIPLTDTLNNTLTNTPADSQAQRRQT